MESCLADLGKGYVEKLINGALSELRYVFCFTRTANEFKEKKNWLEAKIKTMEQHAKVAAGHDNDIEADYQLWKEKAEKLVQEDIQTKQKCFFGLCHDCIWRYKKGKELANNIVEIKQLIEKAEKFVNIEVDRCLPDAERHSSKNYLSFESRESKYKELLDALKDDNNYIVVLQGMGGIGKTTLALKVVKEIKVLAQFTHVINTTVSFTPNIKKIQDDIAGPLGMNLKDCSDSDRSSKLWSRLTTGVDGEKVLLIMDDVWIQDPPLDFDLIGIPKQGSQNCCRVLITTRSKQIFHKMDCDKMIELELLLEEEAWAMFKMYVGPFTESLISTGREIAQECKQLPVAVAVIARSLKGPQDRKHKWDATLKSLKEIVSMDNVDEEKVGIYKCLKSSYDGMKDGKAKGLFLLSSVFPEDKQIPFEILTRLGIGTGLFGKNYGSYNDARNQVVVAIDKLIDSCLLVWVDKEHVKMHDLVREAAQWMAYKEIRHVNLSNKNEKSSVQKEKNMKYLFCGGKDMDLFSWNYDGSKLETLILDVEMNEDDKCMEAPNSFFENIDQLQVLYFSSHDKRPLSLPDSIHSLSNIRSILVDRVDLGDISVLGNLHNLETLDLVKCIIDELPNEISKLGKFKLLNLKRCEIRRNDPFEVIKRCSTLEELYFRYSFNEFCQEITLPELQRYHICNRFTLLPDSLSKYVSFEVVDGNECFFSKQTLKCLMQTTEGLLLEGVEVEWRDLMPEIVPIDQGMKDLVELRLKCISQLQCLVDTNGYQFPEVLPNLVVLDLDNMENLEVLFHGSLSFDSLKNLEKVSIKKCKKLRILFNCNLNLCNLKTLSLSDCPLLVNLFPLLTSQSLVLLEEFKIADCKGLKNIVIDDGDNNDKSHGPMFPKLRVLSIVRCDQLESIFPFLSFEDFPVLEDIYIRKCDKLKYIFGKYQHVELNALKEIKLVELPNLMGIFPEYSHSMSMLVNESSSASRDGSKAKTEVDPVKDNILSLSCLCCHGNNYREKSGSKSTTKVPSVNEDPVQNNSSAPVSSSHDRLQIWEHAQCFQVRWLNLCNVKKILLYGILKIKSVFILSITPRMMLEALIISSCDDLKHIIVDIGDDDSGGKNWGDVFPKLRNLEVNHCNKLEYIFGHQTDEDQNHTKIHLNLPTLQYLDLYNLPSLIAICVKQYCTTFPLLKYLKFHSSNVAIKSIGEVIVSPSDSESLDIITKEELSGSMDHFITLESLLVYQSKAENILCLNGTEGQPINLRFEDIELYDGNGVISLFVGPKNSFALPNLTAITLNGCEVLEIVFSNSISTCLPQLRKLTIIVCNKLKHIIQDDDASNSLSSRTFFPKLERLWVQECHKLKCVFPVSICKKLPKLETLMISEADELEEIFKSNGDQKVEIPNLDTVVFDDLPNLFDAQGSHFQLVKKRKVQNCPKLPSLTSASDISDLEIKIYLDTKFREAQRNSNENPSAETTKDSVGIEVEATLGDEMTSSQKLQIEPSTSQQDPINQQDPLEEIDTAIKPSQCVKEINDQSIQEDYMSDKIVAATISEITNEPPIQLVSRKLKGVEEWAALRNAKTITTSTNSELVGSSQMSEQDVVVRDSLEAVKLDDDKDFQSAETNKDIDVSVEVEVGAASRHELTSSQSEKEQQTSQQYLISEQNPLGEIDNTVNLSQRLEETNYQSIKEESPKLKGVEEGIALTNAKTETTSTHLELVGSSQVKEEGDSQIVLNSISIATRETNDKVSLNDDVAGKVTSIEHQFSKEDDIIVSKESPFSIASKGDPSQKVEELSSSLLVTRELEQLVSKKYLDNENLSLLIDFLAKHPSVLLKDNSLSNRYKGYAYTCLAELLKFLQSHSVLDVSVSGASHFEFVELLQDVRRFPFDKEWLNDVEKRILFPGLQISQAALQKLLDSKHILNEHVKDLKQQLTSSEAVLESITQQETQILETQAALSHPIGY
ncbi:uncharacterized protein LOC131635882 isoform X2 [Vicia villosa]|uniref:uncharacterized protein LOC131635882 isoform X2 n=1 Tax=Vicia villosa TaxID=3911 RepID=UPI00273BC233|nr:uncharacterized protein LOC131635882 isoform X2 [Vicia villosa]